MVGKAPDVKKMLEDNPQIDEEQLQAARKALETTRRIGLGPKGYDLALPYSRTRQALPARSVDLDVERLTRVR